MKTFKKSAGFWISLRNFLFLFLLTVVVVQIFYLPSLVDVLVGIVCYAVGLEICRTIKYTSIIKKKGREAQ